MAEILTFFVGLFVAGFRVGALEGAKVGLPVDVGDFVGLLLASFGVGAFEGTAVGLFVGKIGLLVGDFVGLSVPITGFGVGLVVGSGVTVVVAQNGTMHSSHRWLGSVV